MGILMKKVFYLASLILLCINFSSSFSKNQKLDFEIPAPKTSTELVSTYESLIVMNGMNLITIIKTGVFN